MDTKPSEQKSLHKKSLAHPISFQSRPAMSKIITLYLIIQLFCIIQTKSSIVDNTCTFSIEGKLFSFLYLNRGVQNKTQYKVYIDQEDEEYVVFNFCETFIPAECPDEKEVLPYAYSYYVQRNETTKLLECIPFTSDSITANFNTVLTNDDGQIKINFTLYSQPIANIIQRTTQFDLQCQEGPIGTLKDISISVDLDIPAKLVIKGKSPHACPVFQLSSIWTAISDNAWIFGIILIMVGFIMLFFGVLMTHLMIFISAYFLSFAILGSIFTAILGPESSRVGIYFSLLLILFLSTLFAYGLTKLVNVSIFFIGAFFGFIVGAMVNSIFIQVTGILSYWSLIFFQLIFIIPFGLLTFKYSEEIIVLSSSLTGSYMIVRPFSWIFGGFPNEFTLYDMIQHGQLESLPWTFFLYFLTIIAIAVLGALYQLLKLKRRRPNAQIEKNFITENVQEHIDRIHEAVKNIMGKYSNVDPHAPAQGEDYQKMKEMQVFDYPKLNEDEQIIEPSKTKQRKSRQQVF